MNNEIDIENHEIRQAIKKYLLNIFRGSFLGTFIVDAYTKNETLKIAEALDEICAPTDMVGWASSGVYSFWDYYSREILYIGLAIDLPTRFRQHNGIIRISDKACKYQEINDYFSKHQVLGYSIFPQSSLAQPETFRNKGDINYEGYEYITEETKEIIEIVEGCFIESFKKSYGHLPHWNKTGGSEIGQKRATLELYDLLSNGFMGNSNSLLVSKSSLREIANNSTFQLYELLLHGVRMAMLSRFLSYEEAVSEQLTVNSSFPDLYNELVSNQYLERIPYPCY